MVKLLEHAARQGGSPWGGSPDMAAMSHRLDVRVRRK
jgi:hypothetical protein